jgi:hypothetical protein
MAAEDGPCLRDRSSPRGPGFYPHDTGAREDCMRPCNNTFGAGSDFLYPAAGMRMEWIIAQAVSELSLRKLTLYRTPLWKTWSPPI